MVSGGCAISPWLAPCRPSLWQKIRLHQYVWEVQRDLRDGSYFSWSSTLRETHKNGLSAPLCVCACIRVCMDMCVPSCVKCVRCQFFKSSERQLRECEIEWERERDGKYVCPVHTDLFVWEWINIYVGWKGGWICKTVGTKANNSGAAVQKDGTFPWLLRSPNRLRLEEEDECLLFLSNSESISEPKEGISRLGGNRDGWIWNYLPFTSF